MRNRKRFATLSALGLVAALTASFFGLGATAAFADDENELTKTIIDKLDVSGSYNLVVIEPAVLSNQDLLDDKLFSAYTSIVVVESSALKGYAPEELSKFILQENGNDRDPSLSILVVNYPSGDKIYVSAGDPKLELKVIQILGGTSVEGPISADDSGWEILRNSDAIHKAQEAFEEEGPPGWVIGIIVGSIFIGPFLIWGLVVLILNWRRNRRRGAYARTQAKQNKANAKRNKAAAKVARQEQEKLSKEEARLAKARAAEDEKERATREANSAPVTPQIDGQLKSLRATAKSVEGNDPELANSIELVINRFSELRDAISLMDAGNVKRDILYVEYGAQFESLTTIVGPKYYQDIKRNPTHWRDADVKLESIRKSFDSTADQILESIIQLKEGSELDFQLSIDSILGFKIYSPKDMLG